MSVSLGVVQYFPVLYTLHKRPNVLRNSERRKYLDIKLNASVCEGNRSYNLKCLPSAKFNKAMDDNCWEMLPATTKPAATAARPPPPWNVLELVD